MNMMEIGKKASNRVKEFINIKKGIFIPESGIMVKNTEMVFLYGKQKMMKFHIKANLDLILCMEKENSEPRMEIRKLSITEKE